MLCAFTVAPHGDVSVATDWFDHICFRLRGIVFPRSYCSLTWETHTNAKTWTRRKTNTTKCSDTLLFHILSVKWNFISPRRRWAFRCKRYQMHTLSAVYPRCSMAGVPILYNSKWVKMRICAIQCTQTRSGLTQTTGTKHKFQPNTKYFKLTATCPQLQPPQPTSCLSLWSQKKSKQQSGARQRDIERKKRAGERGTRGRKGNQSGPWTNTWGAVWNLLPQMCSQLRLAGNSS